MSIKEKVAYLSGLMDGLGFDKDSKEGKMFDGILGILEEIIDEMDDIEEDLDELEEFVEALDEDLDELEDILGFDDDDDEDEDEDDEDEDDEDEFVSIKCPSCGKVNYFDPEVLWESDDEVEVLCSACDAVIFSSSECGEDCDCGCGGKEDEDDEDEEDED
ncbi:MAG: CD1247 N-terminal domain-containing protein [Clostridiales bacterium]